MKVQLYESNQLFAHHMFTKARRGSKCQVGSLSLQYKESAAYLRSSAFSKQQ